MKRRLVIAPSRLDQETVTLTDDERHYLTRVLRLQPGDPIELRDGHGRAADGTLLASQCDISRDLVRNLPTFGACPVHLAFALPKGRRLDTLLEKATELGAAAFHPVITERTVARPTEAKDRWTRLIEAAVRQSGAAWTPTVHAPIPLADLLARPFDGLKLVAHPDAASPLRAAVPTTASQCLVLTGPEGGFDAAELTAAETAGFVPFQLGDAILRAETAPLAILTILRHRFGDLG